ncbi:hypothetical protein NW768_002323 [Fusarium equiseti]|uniref:F-box domain-containing protein n=1 Tax=Fusarium equiseti TaxID=61235 RepID=A0ABQ8RN53_FUSEQ|nr:hypothetical protein NW768_002323 [Fusarium equiseti]
MPDDSHLLRMPNEILRLCFEQVAHLDRELAIGYEYYNRRYEKDGSKEHIRVGLQGQSNVEGQYALALTCRRFHDLVIPILYTTVRLDAHEFCQTWAHQRTLFFRSIDDNPSLKLHVKDLTINWDFECVGSDTIRYLAKFPNLERLAVWKMKLEPGMMEMPLPEEKRTSSLTDISFKSLHANPSDIKPLLEWPRNLHAFDFGHMLFDDYELDEPEAWDYAKLTNALEPQRESLRILKIGFLPGYELDLDTLSTRVFPQLHTLSLNMMRKNPSLTKLCNWLSPSLHTLILDFHGDSQCGPFSTFAAAETQKMMRVGSWARRTKAHGGGGENLQRIGIRVFADDSEEVCDVIGEESRCMHNNLTKKLLVKALECLEHHGFQSFWIGASGIEHTARGIRESCKYGSCIA